MRERGLLRGQTDYVGRTRAAPGRDLYASAAQLNELTIIDTPLSPPQQFYAALQRAFVQGEFVKLGLRAYDGTNRDLKTIDIKPVIVKREPRLSFTWHYKTRDVIRNHALDDAVTELEDEVRG